MLLLVLPVAAPTAPPWESALEFATDSKSLEELNVILPFSSNVSNLYPLLTVSFSTLIVLFILMSLSTVDFNPLTNPADFTLE